MIKRIDKKKFGPWAMVTGASSGIGEEFSRQLAANGLNLVLVARRKNLLDTLGKELAQKHGISYYTVGVDLADSDFLETITAVTDKLDIGLVISNAGSAQSGEFIKMDLDKLQRMAQINVLAHLSVAHYFGRKLAEKQHGGIILVSAMGALHGVPFMSQAAATKAYVSSLGEGLHVEFRRYGVNLTVLCPGATNTAAIAELGFQVEGMPMKPMPVVQVVTEGLEALVANRPLIIPGSLNRIMNSVAPPSFGKNMMAKMLAKGHGIKF